jgi:hypothetical protein
MSKLTKFHTLYTCILSSVNLTSLKLLGTNSSVVRTNIKEFVGTEREVQDKVRRGKCLNLKQQEEIAGF